MWATSAPRGPPFSVLKGKSAQTMAVFRWWKSQFPCMHWYNALELVTHCCLDSVTASFNTATIASDPPFLNSFLSIWMCVCSVGLASAICHQWRSETPQWRWWSFYLLLDSTLYRIHKSHICVKCAQKTYHHVRLLRGLRIHPSGGSPADIHQCAQWTGKWQIKRPQERPLRCAQGHLQYKIMKCCWRNMCRARKDALIHLKGCGRKDASSNFGITSPASTSPQISRTSIFLKFKSRKTTVKWAGWHKRHSPFSSAFYGLLILQQARGKKRSNTKVQERWIWTTSKYRINI